MAAIARPLVSGGPGRVSAPETDTQPPELTNLGTSIAGLALCVFKKSPNSASGFSI